ncbi:MAG: T9SS C-terminal target domain-containing protein [Flavobacteriales bacterium]|nr:T9SS C-terminal target domain-containing protein [Crocinitomicaceae bacterium]NBX80176.1 T9SS C-terminal target domain-containing protein [Flavobacteriales bacterium]
MKIMNKLLTFILAIFVVANCYAQPCGTVQTLTTAQQQQLNALGSQLENALIQEDFTSIENLSNSIKTTFGTEGGKPDAEESYYNLVGATNWQNLTNSILLSRQLIAADSLVYANLWKVGKGMAPTTYLPHSIFLRASAEVAVGLLKIADKETDLTRKALYQSWANRALDSLATMQLPNGAFPFPDLRPYGDPVFSPIIQNYLNSMGADSSLVLENGWVVDDNNTGEFKFDAGVIGNAYYEAFVYTGNIQYKNIAISVANYMMPLKMNANYNYNTFVSSALTRGYQLSNDINYLNRAIINLRYGVLPGQLSNGRWVDGHNANSRYHNLIIYNIVPTINLIPSTSPFKAELETMTVSAIQNLIDYSTNCGSATGFRWLIAAYVLDSTIYSTATRNQIKDLIGRHINQATLNGRYLDIQSMGLYIELLDLLTTSLDNSFPINLKTNIFPNPFYDQTNLVFELPTPQKIEVSLHDNLGKLIKVIDNGQKIKGTYNYTINGADIKPGMYFITLKSEAGKKSAKIVKQ